MSFVRFGLEPLVRGLRSAFRAQGTWEKSSEYYILREVYRPLEFLFTVAAVTTLAENFLPQLIALPKAMVQIVVRSTLSLTFVLAAARVVFNVKARVTREAVWKLELSGDLTRQRRVEAVDKLLSVLFLLVTSVLGLQAVGLDVNSVLAIGGVGGLAVGLAGREILENLFTGLIILSSSPFEVGDEVVFSPSSGPSVEGIVIDVGWYRTTIRSFEREVFCIPNSVFSRNVVLNVTRKQREWRFFERIGLRVDDAPRAAAVVADMRKVLRADGRIIQKLHRRVFLESVDRDQATVYISFYVEAANRDAFMAIKQDLLLAFVDCVSKNGAALARSRLQIAIEAPTGAGTHGGSGGSPSGGGGGGEWLALPGERGGDTPPPAAATAAAAAAPHNPTATVDVTATAGVPAASNVVPGRGAAAAGAPAGAPPPAPAVPPAPTTTPASPATTGGADALRAAVAAAGVGPILPDDVLTRSLDGGSIVQASFDELT